MAVTKFNDPNVLAAIVNAEDEFDIPSGLMQSIVVNGERSNSNQVSPKGARTVFQVIPATRNALIKKYGVDAYSPDLKEQARAGALLVKEGLDRNKGNPAAAVAEYHGGTNPRNHGPITNDYTDRVMSGFTGGKMAAVDKPRDLFSDIIAKHGGNSTANKTSTPDVTSQTQDEPISDKPRDLFSDIVAKHGGTTSSQTTTPTPTPSQPQASPEQKQDPSFLDNAVTTGKNFLPSLGNLFLNTAEGLGQIVQHPIDTVKAISDASGRVNNYFGLPNEEDGPVDYANSGFAKDVTSAVNDPKGTIEAAGRHLRDDPAGTIALVAPVATPLKGIEAANALGATARTVGKVANTADLVTNRAVMYPFEKVGSGAVSLVKKGAQMAVVPWQGGRYINELGDVDKAAQASNALKNQAQSNVPGYQRTVEDIAPELAPFQRQTIPSQKRLELDQANDMALTSNVDQGVIPSQNLKDVRDKLAKPLYKQADKATVDVSNKDIYNNSQQFPDVYDQSRADINEGRQYQGQEPLPSTFGGTKEADALLAQQGSDLAQAQTKLNKATERLQAGNLTPEQRAVIEADVNLNKNVVDKLQADIDKRQQVLAKSQTADLNPDEIKRQAAIAKIEQERKKAEALAASQKPELTNNKLATSVDVNQAKSALIQDRLNKSKGKNQLTDDYLRAQLGDLSADSAAKTGAIVDSNTSNKLGVPDAKAKVNALASADKASKIQGFEENSAVKGTNKDRLATRIQSDTDRLALMKAQIAEKEAKLNSGMSAADKAAAEAEIAGNQAKVTELQDKINQTHGLPTLDDVTKMKGSEINQHIKKVEKTLYGDKKLGGKEGLPKGEAYDAVEKHLEQLKAWRDKVLPSFQKADEIFAKYSKSINRSAVMEKFKEKLAPLLDGDSVNARSFATALDNPSKIIDEVLEASYNNKKISGERRLDSIITPEDKQRLTDILDELKRRNRADRYAGTKASLPEGKLPAGNVTTTASGRASVEGLKKGYAAVKNYFTSDYLKKAGSDLQNPVNFAAQIDKALPAYRAVNTGENVLRGTGKVISTVGRKTPLLREIEPTQNNIVNNLRNWLTGR